MRVSYFTDEMLIGRRAWIVLVPIPLAIALVLLGLAYARGPFWLAANQDPAYIYLLNSLTVALGHTPNYYDHPGTPLMLWGAAVLRSWHFLFGGADLARDVLSTPEPALGAIGLSLGLAYVAALGLAGGLALRVTGSRGVALLVQATPFLSTVGLASLVSVSAEPLLQLVGLGLVCVAVRAAYGERAAASLGTAAVFGCLVGVGGAVKITFAPLGVLPLFLLRGTRTRAFYLACAAGMFGLMLLPVVFYVPALAGWLWGLLTHQGSYGTGAAGLFNPRNVLAAVPAFGVAEPVFSAALVGTLVGVAWLARTEGLSKARIAAVIAATQAGQLTLVMKHPGPRYAVPAMSLMGLALGALWLHVRARPRARVVAVGLALVALAVVGLRTVGTARAMALGRDNTRLVLDRVARGYAACATIHVYPSSSQAYALSFGNDFAGNRYGGILKNLYPATYVYLLHRGRVEAWHETVEPGALHERFGCVVFLGRNREASGTACFPPWLVRPILAPGADALYGWDPALPRCG